MVCHLSVAEHVGRPKVAGPLTSTAPWAPRLGNSISVSAQRRAAGRIVGQSGRSTWAARRSGSAKHPTFTGAAFHVPGGAGL